MKTKLLYILPLGLALNMANAQGIEFDQNVVSDAISNYGSNNDITGSARFIGMGGAMGAVGGDLSAISTNPAGLGVYNNSEMSLSLGVNANKNEASMVNSRSTSNTNFSSGSSGGVLSFPTEGNDFKNFNISFNYNYKSLNNNVLFGPNDRFGFESGENTYMMNSYQQKVEGSKSEMEMAFGTNYNDRIYFGAGLKFNTLSIDRYHIFSDMNVNDAKDVAYYDSTGTPYAEDATGFGFSIGVIGKVTENFRLGVAYHTPIWWSEIENTFSYYDADGQNQMGYYDGYSLNTPGKFVFSAAYVASLDGNADQAISANFDFINHFNKNTKFKSDIFDENREKNNAFVDNYFQDSQEYRFGIEYKVDMLKFRAGYAYASSPIKNGAMQGFDYESDKSTSVTNYLAGDKNTLSLGVGYDAGSFYADLAYQLVNSKYYTALGGSFENENSVINATELYGENTLGKVKNTQNNFVLTLGYRFGW